MRNWTRQERIALTALVVGFITAIAYDEMRWIFLLERPSCSVPSNYSTDYSTESLILGIWLSPILFLINEAIFVDVDPNFATGFFWAILIFFTVAVIIIISTAKKYNCV